MNTELHGAFELLMSDKKTSDAAPFKGFFLFGGFLREEDRTLSVIVFGLIYLLIDASFVVTAVFKRCCFKMFFIHKIFAGLGDLSLNSFLKKGLFLQ